jgi:hypothetical protein
MRLPASSDTSARQFEQVTDQKIKTPSDFQEMVDNNRTIYFEIRDKLSKQI